MCCRMTESGNGVYIADFCFFFCMYSCFSPWVWSEVTAKLNLMCTTLQGLHAWTTGLDVSSLLPISICNSADVWKNTLKLRGLLRKGSKCLCGPASIFGPVPFRCVWDSVCWAGGAAGLWVLGPASLCRRKFDFFNLLFFHFAKLYDRFKILAKLGSRGKLSQAMAVAGATVPNRGRRSSCPRECWAGKKNPTFPKNVQHFLKCWQKIEVKKCWSKNVANVDGKITGNVEEKM
jgi:hypothetical protein